jgi:outer membrane protein assembly factor BamB
MKKQNIFYIYSNGRVAAINKKDGVIVWEVKIKQYVSGSVSMAAVGQIRLEDDKLFIGVSGILLCLAAKDGALIWKNDLKGWGYYFVSMTNVGNEAEAGSVAHSAATTAAIIAAT